MFSGFTKIKKDVTIYSLITIIIFFLITYCIYNRQMLYNLFKNSHILIRPETYTELYFKDHASLKKNILTNHQQKIKFVIHNKEGKEILYPYTLSIVEGQTIHILDKHATRLAADMQKDITETFSLASPAAKAKIVIMLPEQHEQIDYQIVVKDVDEEE